MNVLGLGEPDAEALAFPCDLVDGIGSALLLFGSGRGGAADGRWFAEAGITDVTVVDWDAATLDRMRPHMPPGWRAIEADILRDRSDPQFSADHVSADPPSHLAPQILELLPRWLSFARKSVTVTVYRHCFAGEPSLDAPELREPSEGWRFTRLIKRGDFRGGIYWLVGERI